MRRKISCPDQLLQSRRRNIPLGGFVFQAFRWRIMFDKLDDLDRWESAFERRSVRRTRIMKGALLFVSKKSGVQSCTVRDVTNLGAGIRVQDLQIMPLGFELSFDGFRTVRKCRLIWRQDEFFGVAFES
jgi:hypothetical protein